MCNFFHLKGEKAWEKGLYGKQTGRQIIILRLLKGFVNHLNYVDFLSFTPKSAI
jgi:hypothetical protein